MGVHRQDGDRRPRPKARLKFACCRAILRWMRGPTARLLFVLLATAGCGTGLGGVPRYYRARTLIKDGHFAEATDELVALWQDRTPAMVGVHASFLPMEMEELGRSYPPARERFAQLRDAAAPVASDPDPAQLGDWMLLNGVLGESAKTLAWFDQATAERADPRYAAVLEERVIPLLTAANRWSDAGKLYADPLATLERDARAIQADTLPGLVIAFFIGDDLRKLFRGQAASLVRALRAAGREGEAQKVVDRARRLDPSPAMKQAMEGVAK